MKISFVLGHELPFPPERGGGVNSLLTGLCKGISSLGHRVTAYSPAVPGRPDREERDGIQHVRVKGTERRSGNLRNVVAGLPYALRVRQAIEPCDVLSCHLWHSFLFSNFCRAGVVTHTIHRDPKKFLLLLSLLDRFYTGSNAVTNDARQVVPSLERKLRTIHNCVDFSGYSDFQPRPEDGKIRFLFVGRFSRDKGLSTFIPAFCRAARCDPRLYFKSIGPLTSEGGGDESLVASMKDLVNKQGLADRVEFAEPIFQRAQIDDCIRAADVVVLPSISGETLNMSILECMRVGRALLISNLPANRPLNQEGKTGFFAKAGEEIDWEKRILDLAADRARLSTFGAEAYRYGKNRFSCERIAVEYVADFEELLAAKCSLPK